MGTRVRRGIWLTLVALLVTLAAPVRADNFVACWVETVIIPGVGAEKTITRCRLSGGEVVDYAGDNQVPAVLSPALGTDLLGDCWYLTSASTYWVYLNLFVNGDAILGWDPDPSTPGGVAYATDRVPRCTSEPTSASDPSGAVWDYVTAYLHPPPQPDLSPPAGNGVTGLETYAGITIPEDHTASLVASGLSLEVEIEVTGVVVAWGDGVVDSFPADGLALAGYPDGIARHVYEVKDESGYTIEVSYNWMARWRVTGGSWVPLVVPDTTTSLTYPVAEIVSKITG
ncbi:hypothetical protein BH23ACT4_BH23ACT4_15570 [soil metagenome]